MTTPLDSAILCLVPLVRAPLPVPLWWAHARALCGAMLRRTGEGLERVWSGAHLDCRTEGTEERVAEWSRAWGPEAERTLVSLSPEGVAAFEAAISVRWARFGRVRLHSVPLEPRRVEAVVSAGSEEAVRVWVDRWRAEWPATEVAPVVAQRPWAANGWKRLEWGFSARLLFERAALTTVRSEKWRAFEWMWLWSWVPDERWPLGRLERPGGP